MTAATVDYDSAINIVRGDNIEERMALAANPQTPPEFLYYLSDDPDVGVRRTVAENPSTPSKADINLSKDDDISVRCAVARKIVGDGLDTASRRDMWRMGFTILETLMHDSVVKVRRILSEAFRSDAKAPHTIVLGLARDTEESVAAPVLQDSPVLTDADMVSIIRQGAPDWAQQAIAGRASLSPAVADTLISHGQTSTVARLIDNPGSSLAPAALESLVDRSATSKELQSPLVERKGMSGGLLTKLAKFVAVPLLKTLCARSDLDQESVGAINTAISSRDDKPSVRAASAKTEAGSAPSGEPSQEGVENNNGGGDGPAARVRRLFDDGSLTDEAVAIALDRWDNEFVMEALGLRSGYSIDVIRRMVRVKSARTIVALSWKAGFSARFSMDLQRQLAHIPPTKLVNARDGIDYALSTSEMEKQLSLFDA